MNVSESGKAPGQWKRWHADEFPIRLGVSACLLGEAVRFDGGHKRNAFVVDELGTFIDWIPVCPEVEVGMGIPRPPLRLAEDGHAGPTRLIVSETGEDWTERMRTYAEARVAALRELDLDGYILKQNSPSCGLADLAVFGTHAEPLHREGVGMFAERLIECWPDLPVEEEGRLNDRALRENFIERIFARNRWRQFMRAPSRDKLVVFHAAHEWLLRAHDEAGCGELGRLFSLSSDSRHDGDGELYRAYQRLFFEVLSQRADRRAHTGVLQHIMGYLEDVLDSGDKRRVLSAIEGYASEQLPLSVPLTLIRFQIEKHDVGYGKGQLYLDPHPKELMLRHDA